MSEKTELAELKKELAALRAQVAQQQQRLDELKPFLSVQKTKAGRAYLHITCWGIDFCEPDKPNKTQAMLYAGKEGPYLSLWGSDAKARAILKVKDDVAEFSLLAAGLKHAVYLTVKEPGGRGQVAVLDNGNPRAAMQATPQGAGVVSVLHNDGQARAVMVSSEHQGGEFITVTPDMHTGVKISSNAPYGGMVVVHHANGKSGVILACTEELGGVMVNDRRGQIVATVPPS